LVETEEDQQEKQAEDGREEATEKDLDRAYGRHGKLLCFECLLLSEAKA
jgi:hypothetical protein